MQDRGDFAGRDGFTLIELLVVISIIALLMGILLPALQGARFVAQQVQCANNIRQVSIGVMTYAQDHKGWAPDHVRTGTYYSWANVLAIEGYTPGGATGELTAPKASFICPNQDNSSLAWGRATDPYPTVGYTFGSNAGNYWFSTHYAINSYFSYTGGSPARFRLPSTIRPTTTFLVGDASDLSGGMNKYPGLGSRTLSLRHGALDKCNMSMADGHMEVLENKDAAYTYWYVNQ